MPSNNASKQESYAARGTGEGVGGGGGGGGGGDHPLIGAQLTPMVEELHKHALAASM